MTKYLKILSCHYYVQYFSRTICQPEALVLPSLSQALSYEWVSQQATPLSESQTTHTEYEAFPTCIIALPI